jgi:hypothetical protein
MFWFQFTIVGIGAITTILISVKSISNSGQSEFAGHWYFWIGIAAIIFSSLGTAASALNSFYGPRETYLKTERSLSALRQLHSDIVARVTSTTDTEHPENCPKSNPANKDDLYGKQVQDWSAKYGAIVTASDNSTTTQGNANSGAPREAVGDREPGGAQLHRHDLGQRDNHCAVVAAVENAGSSTVPVEPPHAVRTWGGRPASPAAGTAGRWSNPGRLRQARVPMVQLELTPTAKKTTPGHCG